MNDSVLFIALLSFILIYDFENQCDSKIKKRKETQAKMNGVVNVSPALPKGETPHSPTPSLQRSPSFNKGGFFISNTLNRLVRQPSLKKDNEVKKKFAQESKRVKELSVAEAKNHHDFDPSQYHLVEGEERLYLDPKSQQGVELQVKKCGQNRDTYLTSKVIVTQLSRYRLISPLWASHFWAY